MAVSSQVEPSKGRDSTICAECWLLQYISKKLIHMQNYSTDFCIKFEMFHLLLEFFSHSLNFLDILFNNCISEHGAW